MILCTNFVEKRLKVSSKQLYTMTNFRNVTEVLRETYQVLRLEVLG